MEQRNNLVLQGTETFSRGQLDNVALENGALVLDSVAGRSLLYGSYTTPEFAMPAFCNPTSIEAVRESDSFRPNARAPK